MYTRRAFLMTATVAATARDVLGWQTFVRTAEPKPLVVREAKIIRVRDRQEGALSDSYLEITSQTGLKGYAGPLLKEQAAAFPVEVPLLLAGRDVTVSGQFSFGTLWSVCHPGKTLENYVEGKDPLTGSPVWGRTSSWHMRCARSSARRRS